MRTLYTDGGCNLKLDGLGAWAFMAEDTCGNQHFDCGVAIGTTNNRMEMQGAIEALKWLKGRGCNQAIIVADSQYVILGATEWHHGWRKHNWISASQKPVANRDLWEEMLGLLEGMKITWRHVRGHTGDPGNEFVDSLCTDAMNNAKSYPSAQLYRDPGCPTKR